MYDDGFNFYLYCNYMQEQIYFTKEITCSYQYKLFERSKPAKSKAYNPNNNTLPERYCPRCDDKHKDNCNLVQMIIEFNTQYIQKDTICTIIFVDNIKIPLWNRNPEAELGHISSSKYSWSGTHLTTKEKEKLYDEQVIPIETSLYKYNDDIVMTNFNIKLFSDSFADDELESFRCNVNKFIYLFDDMHVENHISEIKYILLTEYKNSYIQKQEFLEKHKPKLYETTITSTIENINKSRSNIIVYNTLSSKSNYIQIAIISKLVTLYLDFNINPLFDALNFGDQKPNPHISKKKKQT